MNDPRRPRHYVRVLQRHALARTRQAGVRVPPVQNGGVPEIRAPWYTQRYGGILHGRDQNVANSDFQASCEST
jgi:hypothetical protein